MNFNKRLFIYLSFAFIMATVIGTITHECGHYIIAKCLGYNAKINYAFTHWEKSSPNQIMYPTDNFWITVGGPFETILTGTIGIVLLFIFRKSFENKTKLSWRQWGLVFVSLFWLRQTANFFIWIGNYFFTGEFSKRGDEIQLAYHLHLPIWLITLATAIIGATVLAIILLKFIPHKQRMTFMLSGIVGGVSGYILWLELFGKYIMP